MEKRTLLGNTYEWTENNWISREHLIEGTVRLIDGKLHYCEPGVLKDEYDIVSQRKETVIAVWYVLGNSN